MTLYDWINSLTTSDWISLAEAIGTLLAVVAALIIAIFQDKMRSWFMHPELEVSIDLCPPDCHKTKIGYGHEFRGSPSLIDTSKLESREQFVDTYYLRMRIQNSGNQRAESVEVFASKLSKQQADGTFKVVGSFSPMNLAWSYARGVFIPAISPRTYKHCDLAHVVDPGERDTIPGEDMRWPNVDPDKTILNLDTVVRLLTKGHLVPFGKYKLEITVAAANAKPVEKTLEITLTGDWYPDEDRMLGEGIGVRIL
jgi:hypothetical protein